MPTAIATLCHTRSTAASFQGRFEFNHSMVQSSQEVLAAKEARSGFSDFGSAAALLPVQQSLEWQSRRQQDAELLDGSIFLRFDAVIRRSCPCEDVPIHEPS